MDLYSEVKKLSSLTYAWNKIRSNGISSPSLETRENVSLFDNNSVKSLKAIQKLLSSKAFQFDKQIGITIKKKDGTKKRGIVMAAISNRIVERSILDCLQNNVKFIQDINNTPTSVGGVPERSVPHGLAIINDCIENKKFSYFVKSDISSFFDNVPRNVVIEMLSEEINDKDFIELLDTASTVTLANEEALQEKEEREYFPVNYDGVAQGSPLSPLFGNILLKKFDDEMNEDGVVCVRFIDDFIVMSNSPNKLKASYSKAKSLLDEYGLECHDPYNNVKSNDKGDHGNINKGVVFLGYHIFPGLLQPSSKARNKLLSKIKERIKYGKIAITNNLKRENSYYDKKRFIQTLDSIDRIIRGWGDAFAYADTKNTTILDLDKKISEIVNEFRNWYSAQSKGKDWQAKRRMMGVGLLVDTKQKYLTHLPYKLEKHKNYRISKDMIVVSTDGSVKTRKKKNSKVGFGGWAAIFHKNGEEISGCEYNVTNNHMELVAVVKAIERTEKNDRVVIRTDSNYVHNIIERQFLIKSNFDLWKKYQDLSSTRRVSIEWVRGHAGDEYNEKADELATKESEDLFKKHANHS